ncbi:hypothetical protein PR048_015002 [Dryococelus australis]|uniref:C2H2-type domain-containing protein n=1 Tax=Dryococelus australis TaxID=614101 RepID=A0ABQ9HFY9_9NEOP|nr:hypothetical protein PR048_015002 [Dryococelus australis]
MVQCCLGTPARACSRLSAFARTSEPAVAKRCEGSKGLTSHWGRLGYRKTTLPQITRKLAEKRAFQVEEKAKNEPRPPLGLCISSQGGQGRLAREERADCFERTTCRECGTLFCSSSNSQDNLRHQIFRRRRARRAGFGEAAMCATLVFVMTAARPIGNLSQHAVTNQIQSSFPELRAANQRMGVPTSREPARRFASAYLPTLLMRKDDSPIVSLAYIGTLFSIPVPVCRPMEGDFCNWLRTWLDYLPSTKANRARFPARSPPDFRVWESNRTMPLVGGSPRRSPVSPALEFRRCSIITSLHPYRLSRPRC